MIIMRDSSVAYPFVLLINVIFVDGYFMLIWEFNNTYFDL